MKLYILLPAYNEGKSLIPLMGRIKKGMEDRGFAYEVVVYNDGSTDDTRDILKRNEYGIPLRIIGKERNEGLGSAFLSLLNEVVRISSGAEDIAVVLDSDNTHNPEHIYQMANKIRDGFDLAIASRYLRDSRIVGLTRFRQLLSFGASWMMRILYPIKGVRDYTCGYRAYSIACLRRAFDKYGDSLVEERGFACMAELLIKLRSLHILAVEIPLVLRYDHKVGESKIHVWRTARRTVLMLLRLKRRH